MLEGISTEVVGVELVLNPSRCVKVVSAQVKFAMGSAHGERGLEVEETAHGEDTLIQRGVDSNLYYPFPSHDVPSRLLDRLVVHYQLAPEGMHEESGVYH